MHRRIVLIALLLALLFHINAHAQSAADALWLEVVTPVTEPARQPDSIRVTALGNGMAALFEDLGDVSRVTLHAATQHAGKTAVLRAGEQELATAKLTAHPLTGMVGATLTLREPLPQDVSISIDGAQVLTAHLPSAALRKQHLLARASMAAFPYVFSGHELPPVGFESPALARQAIGSYQIDASYLDNRRQSATDAQRNGRFAAIVQITPETGPVLRRYLTLYRHARPMDWRTFDPGITLDLPDALAINPNVAREQTQQLNNYLQNLMQSGLGNSPSGARLLAGLYETQSGLGRADASNQAFTLDRQWWVKTKRQQWDLETRFPEDFKCPRPNEQMPTPELKEGTVADAAMNDAVERELSKICNQWSTNSQEPFTLCVARNGVVFFHEAYGVDDRQRARTDMRGWYGSLAKTITGVLAMTLVDQKRLELDAPLGSALPPLKTESADHAITLRQLFTHTSGLWGDWGRQMDDLEEVVAGYQPHLEPGARFAYSGTGYALAGKAIEVAGGSALPIFAREHLFTPLAAQSIDLIDASTEATGTAMDLAKIGQLLLNKGSYGSDRYFSEEAFAQMLPQSVDAQGALSKWGVGLAAYEHDGLGEGTFGHDAGSGTMLRVDPTNGLVIVLVRNNPGEKYDEYRQAILKAVVENLGSPWGSMMEDEF